MHSNAVILSNNKENLFYANGVLNYGSVAVIWSAAEVFFVVSSSSSSFFKLRLFQFNTKERKGETEEENKKFSANAFSYCAQKEKKNETSNVFGFNVE